MRRLAIILAVWMAAASARALSVAVSNDLSIMDVSGWHTNAPYACWPASNHLRFAAVTNGHYLKSMPAITTNISGGATNIVTNMVDTILTTNNTTAFYTATNLFIWQTNFTFTVDGMVTTQAFDAVLSAAGDPHGGVSYPYTNYYTFMVSRTNTAGETVEGIVTQSMTFTTLPPPTMAAKFNARQLRIWGCYQALYERAHVQATRYRSTDDQQDGSNYPRRVAMGVPWVTFYRRPWEAMLNEQAALMTDDVISDASWFRGSWIDPAYMSNIVDRVNAVTNVQIEAANVLDYFPIGGASIDPSNAFDMATAYNIPTNYASWVPANLAWVENMQRKHIETNTFMTWTTNGEVVSTAIWTNAPIAAGRVSTDYGLDTLRPLLSATRYSLTRPAFALDVQAFGSGSSMVSPADALADALATAVVDTNTFDVEAGWDVSWSGDATNGYSANFHYAMGTLYASVLPEGFVSWAGFYQGNSDAARAASESVEHSATVYAVQYYDQIGGGLTNATPQFQLELFAATTNALMPGSYYGHVPVAGDMSPTPGLVGSWHRLTFGVLDYGSGWKYK